MEFTGKGWRGEDVYQAAGTEWESLAHWGTVMPCSWSVGQLAKGKNGKVGRGQVNTELVYVILRNGISTLPSCPRLRPRILAPRAQPRKVERNSPGSRREQTVRRTHKERRRAKKMRQK